MFSEALSIVCVCYLKNAGSPGHTLQYAGLIAVLEEDGSVVVDILHLYKHSGCARPPAARWTVVCVQKHTQKLQSFRLMPIFCIDARKTAIDMPFISLLCHRLKPWMIKKSYKSAVYHYNK